MAGRGWWVFVLGLGGCLELNPDYADRGAENTGTATDAPATTSATDAATESSSTADADESNSSGATGCTVDPLEPNDDIGDASDVLATELQGSGVVADFVDVDWYKGYVDPGGPAEIVARATPGTVQTCVFLECNTTTDPAVIDSCSGTLAVNDPTGFPGCCALGVAAVQYTCSEGFDVVFYASVYDPTTAACIEYDVAITTQ